jgi:hypothetical protein
MKRCFLYSTHAFCATQQAVFATFIDGDDGGKEGLEQLQTRLRRISTCSQFVAKWTLCLVGFVMAFAAAYFPHSLP